MSHAIFDRAEAFIWNNARLLDRQRFAYHFKGGSREAAIAALRAYQNADGGFGHALEPDIRCPESQPVPVQHALEFLDDIGVDAQMVQRACDYLMTITTPEGGVPWLLPSAHRYPRAPWWNAVAGLPASLNPTAAIAGVLHKNEVGHAWLAPATAYCWSQIADMQAEEMHEMGAVLSFLYHAPDRERADRERDRLVGEMLSAGLVADARAAGYVRKPLDWAPTPDHPLREYFREADIAANLDALIADQREDGGWPITWRAASPSCELEWRGWVTLGALLALRANGRLDAAA